MERTGINTATRLGKYAVVKKLLQKEHGLRNYTTYQKDSCRMACEHGQAEILKLFLDHGYTLNDNDFMFCFRWAISRQHLNCIEVLFTHEKSKSKMTVGTQEVRQAIGTGNAEIVKFLLKQEDGKVTDERNRPLREAIFSGNNEIIALLLQDPRVKASIGLPNLDIGFSTQ